MIVKYQRSRMRKYMSIILVSVLSTFIYLSLSNVVKAEDGTVAWSWTNASPVVTSSSVVSNVESGLCSNSYQTKEVMGYRSLKKVCIASGDSIRVGVYDDGNFFRLAVGFRFDTKMYEVNGICTHYNECLYLPGSDTLVITERVSGNAKSLVVFKNFFHRLTPVIYPGVISTLGYDFDASNPDYIFKRDSGSLWLTGSIGASSNGDWLAVELRQSGVGLLNLSTLEMRRISPAPFYYGYGMDPTSELAVSNDGKRVAVMGMNAGLAVYDVDSDCGEVATDDITWSVGRMDQPCKKALINTEEFIHRFANALQPRFDNNGGELDFLALSYTDAPRQVALSASGYVRPRIDYLALGDSFTSGEGETDDGYYLNGTNDEYEKCHLSTRSYPYLIAKFSNIDLAFMRSVACSGAVTADVIGDDRDYLGQGKRLGENGVKYSSADITLAKAQSIYSFVPGRVPQKRFIDEYKPKIITIGIGGNDAGFMDILKTCIIPGTCEVAGTVEGKEKMAIEIKNIFGSLVETYNSVHIASPSSKIYAIGYPKIISDNASCNTAGKVFNDTERQFMNEGVKYLNEVIAAAAKSAGVRYVDVYDAYGEHVLCGNESDAAMGAIMAGDDSNIINDSRWFRFVGNESFHPNSLGHFLVAGSVLGSIGNILEYNYCDNGDVVCPDQTAVAPEPSTYWIPDGYHGYPVQMSADFVSDRYNIGDGKQKQIKLTTGSLLPNSSVEIVLKSDPVSLGSYITSDNGSLDVDIDLPVELEEGYHTIHVYGTSHSGESIDLYQVIEYRLPYIEPTVSPDPVVDVIDTTVDIDIIDDTNHIVDIVHVSDIAEEISDEADTAGVGADDYIVPFVNSKTNNEVTDYQLEHNNVSQTYALLSDETQSSNNVIYQLDETSQPTNQSVKGVSVAAVKPASTKENGKSVSLNTIAVAATVSIICAVIFAIARMIFKTKG